MLERFSQSVLSMVEFCALCSVHCRLFKVASPTNAGEGRGINRWLHGVAGDCDVLAVAKCATRENAGVSCELPSEGAGPGMWIDEQRRIQPWISK